MDMDAMYQMMKGGQPCYECGGKVYQQGGQQDQVMQAIQMYAQMTQTDPEQLMAQLQSLPPLEQQEAIQKIMQAIQEAQAGQMKNGGIYINPANKGKFTESANRAGMGVQEFARKVLANKEDYSATQVKRANFARNAASWKKQFGGMTEGAELELHPDEIQALIDQGYGIEYLD
jgi:Zn-dependent oligopeptidase